MNNLLNTINNNPQFETYYNELIEYNKNVNLTAITEKQEVYLKHFLDSVLPINEIKKNATVVDVGSGAGFPGLPIKILREDVNLTLVDSLNKRTMFLQQVCKKLNLNVSVNHSRAEDFCLNNRQKFDVAVARAVAKLNTLLEYLLPLVKINGIVLAYKGDNFLPELNESQNAIKILGGQYEKTLTFNLTDENNNIIGKRNIIVIKKIKPTPAKYPRAQNKPKTQPIT